VLQQSITLAEGKAHRGDISLKLDLDSDLPMLDGDFHQLCQVFSNLLINAFEALDGQGQIAIRAAAEVVEPDPAFSADTPMPTRALVVEVIDNGPGVSAELSDRIFVPFFTTKPKGSAWAANRRKIVDAHEGRIDLSSSVDMGTTFSGDAPGFGRRELVQIERHAPLWVEYYR
jgi:signal transduction histidine kinase